MPIQIARVVGAVVAALMVTLVHFESHGPLVARQVGLFVLFQTVRVAGAEVAALVVTQMYLEFLVDRQVGLFVCFQVT